MTAIEMFERLGYRCIKSDNSIWYINDSDKENYRSVEFYFCDCTFDAIGNYGDPLMVNVKELEAINKQCEELGWLEEENVETNLDHYSKDIAELFMGDLTVVDGKPKRCIDTVCDKRCDFYMSCDDEIHDDRVAEWFKEPYKKPTYKLTKFEYDLLSVYKDFKTYNQIANQIHLFKMHEKGYFKGIDTKIPIREILDNCEVIE